MKTVGHYQYREEDELGRGSFSRVYLGTPAPGVSGGVGVGAGHDKVAIKVIELPKSDGKTKHLLREIELMRHLKHRNIVRLIDVKYEKYGQMGLRIFIIMEYCEKGDMASLPRPMSEENCRHYFRGIFSGLRYLKKRQIIHRDIKPQNILLTSDNEVKIADFTFSKQIEEDELLQTQCGTPLFISPDVMFGKPYTDKSDLYSCGVMLYSFLYGTHPLGNVKSQADLIQKMKRAKITFPQKLVYETYEKTTEDDDDFVLCRTIRVFSPDVLRLCKGLLKFNPAERISWDIVYDDPWLRLDPIDSDELFPSETIQASDEILEVGGTIHAFSAPSQFSDRRLVPVPRSSQPFRRSTVEDISPPLTTPPNTTCKQHSFEQRATNNSSVENTENTSGKSSEMSGGGATRIIQDYYSSSPDMFTGGAGMFSLSPSGATKVITDIEQHINKKTANQSPPTLSKAAEAKPKDTNIHTFLSRSIDTIQKVFSL